MQNICFIQDKKENLCLLYVLLLKGHFFKYKKKVFQIFKKFKNEIYIRVIVL